MTGTFFSKRGQATFLCLNGAVSGENLGKK